jgi:single-strand DNA-binding protein
MANHIQMVMYEGFLGKEPEMRFTPAGKAVSNFNIGSTSQYKNQAGEVVKTTTWLRVTCWGKLAEIVNEYTTKGSHVIVTGVLKPNKDGRPEVYAEGKNGPTASFDVTASSVRIIKGKDGGAVAGSAQDDNDPFAGEDDLPF